MQLLEFLLQTLLMKIYVFQSIADKMKRHILVRGTVENHDYEDNEHAEEQKIIQAQKTADRKAELR